MSMDIKFDERKYNSNEIDRTTSANSHNSNTIIKYIIPRVISPNISNNLQGSLNYINFPATAPTHGLASLVHMPRYSTLPSIHSIDGERTIDEHRELLRITETLANTILEYCNIDAHNRALQSQLDWLENHSQENSLIIERKYQSEMASAQKLIDQSCEHKQSLQRKFNDVSQLIFTSDEQYQQLLTKRNLTDKDLFNLERQIAQNYAESHFLQRRIQYFDEQMKFYMLKNRILYERKVRLRYNLDEEIFSQQSLKLDFELLEKDKITNEDIHCSSIDDVRQSIDITQIGTYQLSKTFSQHLNQEIQRIRDEFSRKLEIYREDLHRQFELVLHRYQIQKSNSLPTITREHHFRLEQYQHENNDVQQQIAATKGSINQIMIQIETLEQQIQLKKADQQTLRNNQVQLNTLNQLIQQREKQLEDSLRIRNQYKNEIENYRKRFDRYSKTRSVDYRDKRISLQEYHQSPSRRTSISSRLSLQDLSNEKISQPKNRLSITQIEDLWEEGTLIRYVDFNLDQDCHELHRILSSSSSNRDENRLIRILCNRSIGQRLQIRDKYKTLFNENLSDSLETLINQNFSKLLRVLLLSPIERDCLELRRILKSNDLDFFILIEFFFTRTNKHIQSVKHNYTKLFQSSIEEDLNTKENLPFKQLFVLLIDLNRSEETTVDEQEIENDVRSLSETKGKWKTDQSILNQILSTRSNVQLKQVLITYQQLNQIDFEQEIEIYTDGNLYQILLAIVRIVRNRPQFFAYQLQTIFKNTTMNTEKLNRIIVSRCEIDMVQIKYEYEKLAQRTLYDHIQMDTTGDYKRALSELIRQRIEPIYRKSSDEQSVVFRNRSSQRINRVQSDTFLNQSTDRTWNRRGQIYDDDSPMRVSLNDQFDSNNQGKSNSLSRLNHIRSFNLLPSTTEHPSHSNHDEE